jgi:hypothetical protein
VLQTAHAVRQDLRSCCRSISRGRDTSGSAADFVFVEPARIGGKHAKEFWRDANGDLWLFKPVKPGDEFIAHGERAAYELQARLDPRAIEVRTVTLGGRFGSIQRWRGELADDADFGAIPVNKLSPGEIKALQREHVLDWLISNHDAHPKQFLRGKDGHVWGIDKGQAWKYFGQDRLSVDYHPNAVYGEREPIYNTLWRAWSKKQVTLNPNVTLEAAHTLRAIPDNDFQRIIADYAAARFKTDVGRKAFLHLALERKNRLTEEFERFIVRQMGEREAGLRYLVTEGGQKKLSEAEVRGKIKSLIAKIPAKKLGSLSDEEVAAINFYTRSAYKALNQRLRHNLSPMQITREEIDVFSATNLLDDALAKLPAFEGVVYRGTFLPYSIRANMQPGTIFSDHAFMSTSAIEDRVFGGNVNFIITSRSGRKIVDFSDYPAEAEVLFPAGTRFIVKNVVPNPADRNVLIVKMEEITGSDLDALSAIVRGQ